jgi:tetratricopeptide (TPR) repeat protein
VKAPRGLLIAWQAAGERTVSHAETLGLGGIFLYTDKPLSKGSMIDLIIDVGAEGIRARAIVRHTRAGKGLGLQFVQMRSEDRARLNRFLQSQEAQGNEKPASDASDGKAAQTVRAADKPTPPVENPKPSDELRFEGELKSLLAVAERGTYYQLLGVTPEAPKKKVKENFYTLARKFHPDHHMGSKSIDSLQKLMEVVTAAYKTLRDEQSRASYDKKLAASGAFNLERGKTDSQETVEECIQRATECLNAKNFAGSIVWLRKCVAMAPGVSKYHATLARSLANVTGYRNEAIEHFQTAIELDPWNTAAYFQFAELYEKMQLPWRARPLYQKILEIDPGHAKACQRLEQFDSENKEKKPRQRIARFLGKEH